MSWMCFRCCSGSCDLQCGFCHLHGTCISHGRPLCDITVLDPVRHGCDHGLHKTGCAGFHGDDRHAGGWSAGCDGHGIKSGWFEPNDHHAHPTDTRVRECVSFFSCSVCDDVNWLCVCVQWSSVQFGSCSRQHSDEQQHTGHPSGYVTIRPSVRSFTLNLHFMTFAVLQLLRPEARCPSPPSMETPACYSLTPAQGMLRPAW